MSANQSKMLWPKITAEPQNALLAALLSQVGSLLRPHLQPVFLNRKDLLIDVDEPLNRCYFPQGGTVVSMISVFQDGRMSETATVGNEGVVPVGAALGERSSFAKCIVQFAGPAMALDAAHLRNMARTDPAVSRLFSTFIATLLLQVLRSAACNAVHTAEQRCARWLLTAMDRSGGDCFAITQEVLAEMLGVHRPTVSVVTRSLQQGGMIRCSRGAITVIDRLRLEQAACECYRLTREKREQLSRPLLSSWPWRPATSQRTWSSATAHDRRELQGA
jgi:CRP-like cAMP-binding protein